MTCWLHDVQKMDSTTLVILMKMGAKVQKLLEVKDKMASTVKAGLTGRKLGNVPNSGVADSATLSNEKRS